MDVLDPLQLEFWTAIGVALLCGIIVGLERQVRGKTVGVRTSILICLSTYIFVQLGTAADSENSDPTRVLGQVVTGVGFLGAGVILARGGVVSGVTTAAVIWVLASIGALVGFGQLHAAVVVSLISVVVLIGVDLLEPTFRRLGAGIEATRDEPGGGDE